MALVATSSEVHASEPPACGSDDPVAHTGGLDLQTPGEPFGATAHGLFVNFDGVTLASGGRSDSQNDVAHKPSCAGTYAPFNSPTDRAGVMDMLREIWGPFNVNVTDQRPASGNYTMVVVSPSNICLGQAAGLAPYHCGDHPNAVGLAKGVGGGPYTVVDTAYVVSHEAGHTLGMGHAQTDDMMLQGWASLEPRFIDDCVVADTSRCGNLGGCGAGTQNSHEHLLDLFGPKVADSEGPAINLETSGPATVVSGGAVALTATAMDASGIANLALFENGTMMAEDIEAPFEWQIDGRADGTYTYHVIGVDTVGNESQSNTLMVTVGASGTGRAVPGGTTGAGTDGSIPGSIPGAGTDGVGAPSLTGPGSDLVGLEDGGCNCRASLCDPMAPSAPSTMVAWIPLVVLVRRRQRA